MFWYNVLISVRKLKKYTYFNVLGIVMLSLGYVCLINVFNSFRIYGRIDRILVLASLAFFCSDLVNQFNMKARSQREISIRQLLGAGAGNIYGLAFIESLLRSIIAIMLSLIILDTKVIKFIFSIQAPYQSIEPIDILFLIISMLTLSIVVGVWSSYNLPGNNVVKNLRHR